LQFRQAAVFKLCQLVQIVVAFCGFHVVFNGINFLFNFAHTADGSFLCFPAFNKFVVGFFELCQFFFNFGKAIFALLVVFFLQSLCFNFQLQNAALAFVKFGRQAVDFGTQARCGFVYKVYCLIRQKAVVNITVA